MYPLVFFVTCFNLLYVLLLDTFLKCLILHRNAPRWRVCTDLKWTKTNKNNFQECQNKNDSFLHWILHQIPPFGVNSYRYSGPIGLGLGFGDGDISLCRLFGLYSLQWMGLLQFYTVLWALWRVTGSAVAGSSGKDVSAVMWRSLLVTMTVIPLSGLSVLWSYRFLKLLSAVILTSPSRNDILVRMQ